jgi:hypothetical protein
VEESMNIVLTDKYGNPAGSIDVEVYPPYIKVPLRQPVKQVSSKRILKCYFKYRTFYRLGKTNEYKENP